MILTYCPPHKVQAQFFKHSTCARHNLSHLEVTINSRYQIILAHKITLIKVYIIILDDKKFCYPPSSTPQQIAVFQNVFDDHVKGGKNDTATGCTPFTSLT